MVPGGLNGQLLSLMLILFILGFFLEWIEISYIAFPLFCLYSCNPVLTWHG